jgi:hypothetical protein
VKSRLAVLLCLAAVGCDEDPARSVRIISRPVTPAAVVTSSAQLLKAQEPVAPLEPGEPRPWSPPGCPPPPDVAEGPSSLVVTGPCAFAHKSEVDCEVTPDDMLVTLSRKAAHGATLMIYLNVEKYHGSGDYDEAQMFVGVQDRSSIYRWSSDSVHVTVGPGEAFVTFPATKVDAERQLIQCTGPMTNYQCGDANGLSPILNTAEVVTGTLSCKKK